MGWIRCLVSVFIFSPQFGVGRFILARTTPEHPGSQATIRLDQDIKPAASHHSDSVSGIASRSKRKLELCIPKHKNNLMGFSIYLIILARV